MQYGQTAIDALNRLRVIASEDTLAEYSSLVDVLDKAGVFAALDEQNGMAEAERHMQAIQQERAARCTCSARRAGMQGTDIHVLGCPAVDVPAPRGSARMECPPVGEPLYGNVARGVVARLREQIGDDRFDYLFPGNVHVNTEPKPDQCPTCHATDFADAEALQFHIDAVH